MGDLSIRGLFFSGKDVYDSVFPGISYEIERTFPLCKLLNHQNLGRSPRLRLKCVFTTEKPTCRRMKNTWKLLE